MNAEYVSHVPLLLAAMARSSGPVLELGAGLGSTPALHGACALARRRLVTLDSDPLWLAKFAGYGRDWHAMRLVRSFADLPEYGEPWGLVLVDHGEARLRGASIAALRHAELLVVHDTDYPQLYGYEPVLSEFRYRYDWKRMYPQTTIVSDTLDVAALFGGFDP